ncbi:hypothetical protein PG994_013842 [Apiospora phragmitis]|uniref:Uncharacterized protein n=1 Tax=Apiospora phragmitis TaxID=2905665 RepID=A0ABR1T4E6_9PEZI
MQVESGGDGYRHGDVEHRRNSDSGSPSRAFSTLAGDFDGAVFAVISVLLLPINDWSFGRQLSTNYDVPDCMRQEGRLFHRVRRSAVTRHSASIHAKST